MGSPLYIGIDGGGTTTRARLTNAAGTVLGEGTAGGSNLNAGVAAARQAVLAATTAALTAAGLGADQLADSVAGLGLAGANVPALARTFSAEPLPFGAVALTSDAVIACLGAHGGGDGAILILGTGSQGFMRVNGSERAIGGWGFELSDEGSGAALGRAAIRAAILSYDGIAEASDLTRAIMARFGHDPARAAVWGKTATPADYAQFAPLVFEHFGTADPIAADLLADASTAVALMLDRLIALGAMRIALVGGLADAYRPLLQPDLRRFLVARAGDALDGALALARRRAGDVG